MGVLNACHKRQSSHLRELRSLGRPTRNTSADSRRAPPRVLAKSAFKSRIAAAEYVLGAQRAPPTPATVVRLAFCCLHFLRKCLALPSAFCGTVTDQVIAFGVPCTCHSSHPPCRVCACAAAPLLLATARHSHRHSLCCGCCCWLVHTTDGVHVCPCFLLAATEAAGAAHKGHSRVRGYGGLVTLAVVKGAGAQS